MKLVVTKGRERLVAILVMTLALVGIVVLTPPNEPEPRAIVAYSAPALDHALVDRATKRQQVSALLVQLDRLSAQAAKTEASIKASERIKATNARQIASQQQKAAALIAQVRGLRQQVASLNAKIVRLEAQLSRLRTRLAQQRAAVSRPTPPAPSTTSTSIAALKAWARAQVGDYQFQYLDRLWMKESGWRWNADNPTSDAYGIPQALPGSKMASAGADWATNPYTQMRWGLGYIRERYGTPEAAWNHSVANNWY